MAPLAPLALAPAAFLAGVLMFLAPCTLPLVPGYLAFVGAGRPVRNAFAFVIGFSLVFILLGTFAGFFGVLLGPYRPWLARSAGLLIIFFGLTMLGVLRLPVLVSEHRASLPKFLVVGTLPSSLLIGALFALGWSPCIGPILGTVLLVASTSGAALQGAFLLLVFSLGLGLPFLLTAMWIEKAGVLFSRWGKGMQWFSYLGGAILVMLGVLMVLGGMGLLVTAGFQLFDGPYRQLLNYM